MNITIYNQGSDINKLTKALGTGVLVQGTIKDESSIVNPEIVFSRAITEHFNYLYIPAFDRYYFVTDKTVEHQRTIINCHVDVLMSFNAEIKALNVIAERASNNYNLYQVDNELSLLNYKVISTKSFTNGFNNKEGSSYLLATAGG